MLKSSRRRAWVRSLYMLVTVSATIMLGHRVSHAAPLPSSMCSQSQPTTSNSGFPEVRGTTAHHVKLWGLLFYHPPAVAGSDLKIVIRMTGTGPLHVVAVGPDGGVTHHTWIEAHSSSSWNRAGNEWGTGWQIPTAGCWRLHASRHGARGDIWFEVVAAP